MKLIVKTILDAPVDTVYSALRQPRLLDHVAAPVIAFTPEGETTTVWPEGARRYRMRFFGVVPIGWQIIDVSFAESRAGERLMRDRGSGALARRWAHLCVLAALPGGRTAFRDELDVGAGLLTPSVWLFARCYYRHRQRRLRRLARAGFPGYV
ncbi:hypothetical protein [Methylocella sp.]|uniref:hypothetical protein n=1 Tax=Methylocella sp. TaxID=1978226 RepID=UPI003783D9CF